MFGGYRDAPPYRPSVEIVRKKEGMAWDRRIRVPVTRPGSWTGDPWMGDVKGDGWEAIELSKLAPAVDRKGSRR